MSATYCIPKYNSSIISYLGEVEVVAFLISVWAGMASRLTKTDMGNCLNGPADAAAAACADAASDDDTLKFPVKNIFHFT